MSEWEQLVTGIALVLASIGAVYLCRPRNGKAVWFARTPFLAPMVSIVIIGGLAMGLILLAAYFTNIDVATLKG